MNKLTSKESGVLMAMVRRVGLAAVLHDLEMLVEERDEDEWQQIAAQLNELVRVAQELE
jgi:hypothetical protein